MPANPAHPPPAVSLMTVMAGMEVFILRYKVARLMPCTCAP